MEKEIWKPVPNYEFLCEVSNKGRVRNCDGLIMKLQPSARGYKRIHFYKFGKHYNFKVHRLVALAFIPNPENKPYINHKNEIKTDNRVENLEWVTAYENYHFCTKNKKRNCKRFQPVIMYDLNGKELARFSNTRVASLAIGISEDCIRAVCKNQQRTAKGYKWRYASE